MSGEWHYNGGHYDHVYWGSTVCRNKMEPFIILYWKVITRKFCIRSSTVDIMQQRKQKNSSERRRTRNAYKFALLMKKKVSEMNVRFILILCTGNTVRGATEIHHFEKWQIIVINYWVFKEHIFMIFKNESLSSYFPFQSNFSIQFTIMKR